MADPKVKPAKREAGKSKFRLPERTARPAEENPLRELLKEAKAQEEALKNTPATPTPARHTPAKKIAGVQAFPFTEDTPAKKIAGVSPAPKEIPPSESHETIRTFGDFSKRWSPILRSGQMSVCRVLYEMTFEQGLAECFTSMPRLASAAGIKERQCYNVIAQLEMLGFIERPEIFNTSTQKGTVFRLHLEPRPMAARARRRYHIGSEEIE